MSRPLTGEEIVASLQELDENNSDIEGVSDNDELQIAVSHEKELVESNFSRSQETSSDSIDTPNSTLTQHATPSYLCARDGTKWKIMDEDIATPGRFRAQNVLKEKAGPTSYANRNIGGNEASSWRLLISEAMLKHIQKCTIEEAHLQLKSDTWSISKEELDAFIALVYVRGAMCASSLDLNDMWSKQWGPPIFTETMSRDQNSGFMLVMCQAYLWKMPGTVYKKRVLQIMC